MEMSNLCTKVWQWGGQDNFEDNDEDLETLKTMPKDE